MADSQGRNPGDKGYDQTTESQNPNNAYPSPNNPNTPGQTITYAPPTPPAAGNPFTFINPTTKQPDPTYQPPNAVTLPNSAGDPVKKSPDGTVVDTKTGQAPVVNEGFKPSQMDPTYLQNFSQVQSMLMNAGWTGEDPNYWVGRIMQTGGFTPENVGYWSHRIGLGPNGQPSDSSPAPTPSTNNTIQDTITSALSAGLPGSQTPLPSDSANQLYQTLLDRSGQSLKVDPNDPIIKGQTNAYNATNEQDRRKYLADLAEKSGPNADLGAETRSTYETTGQKDAQFQATLMANELTARRTEIQNALTEQGSLLSDQQKIQLQQQLGLIDAALRQQSINSGNDQFAANFGLSAAEIAWLHNQIQSGGPTS